MNCGKHYHKPLIAATENPTNTALTGLAALKSSTTIKEALLQTALAKLSVNGQEVTVWVLLNSEVSGPINTHKLNIAESIGLQGPSETSTSKRFQWV